MCSTWSSGSGSRWRNHTCCWDALPGVRSSRPRGTIRTVFLLALGYGLWLWTRHHDLQLRSQPVILVLGAFVAGVMVRWFLGQVRSPADTSALMIEHVQGFAALAAAAGLGPALSRGQVGKGLCVC